MQKVVTHKKTNIFLTIALGLIVACLLLILYWLNQPTNVLTINNSPFPVRAHNAPINDNGIVILHVDYCKNTDTRGALRMSFVSKRTEVFLPVVNESTAKGCHQEDLPVLVPSNLPPDVYYIKFRATYDVNPLKQSIVNSFSSQIFTVAS